LKAGIFDLLNLSHEADYMPTEQAEMFM